MKQIISVILFLLPFGLIGQKIINDLTVLKIEDGTTLIVSNIKGEIKRAKISELKEEEFIDGEPFDLFQEHKKTTPAMMSYKLTLIVGLSRRLNPGGLEGEGSMH